MTELEKKKSFAELALELEEICEDLDSYEGDVTNDVYLAKAQKFFESKEDNSTKIDSWYCRSRVLTNSSEFFKEERDKFNRKIKHLDNLIKSSKEYLKSVMTAFPALPYKGHIWTMVLKKNPPAVNFKVAVLNKNATYVTHAEVDKHPDIGPFIVTEVLQVLDKEAVRAALKTGQKLSFAELTQGERVEFKL